MSYAVYPDDGGFTAECRETGVASCGDTMEEATANLREVIELYCDTIRDLALQPWEGDE